MRRRPHAWRIAVFSLAGCTLLVLAQRLFPEPDGSLITSLLFVATVLVAGLFGGWKAGLATTLSAIAVALFLFSPSYLHRISTNALEFRRLLAFASLGIVLSGICEVLQRAWSRIEDRQRQLEAEIAERRKAEHTSQVRARELLTTLASIGDGVIRTDTAGRVTFMNVVAEQLTGWSAAEAEGKDLLTVFSIANKRTREQVENPVERVLQLGVITGLGNNTILIARDGVERPIEESAAPIRDPNGRLIGVVLIFRDVTERRRAEESLRRSEAESRRLQEYQGSVMANMEEGLYTVDTEGLVTYMNPAAERLFGWTCSELLGRRMHEMTHYKHPDGTPFPIEECSGFRVLREGIPLRDFDDVFIRKNGEFFPVSYSSAPIVAEEKVCGLVVVFRDMTDRLAKEADLRTAQRRFQAVFNQQFQFMAILNPDGTVVDANETCFIATGVGREHVIGRQLWKTPWWSELPQMQQLWEAAVSEVAESGGPISRECDYVLADGTVRHATAYITGLIDDAGQVSNIIVEGHDDTERKQHDMALWQSEERLRLALDAGRMGVWDWNIKTGGLKWSKSLEPMQGSETGMLGGTFDDFQRMVHPDDRELVNRAIQQAIETGGEFDIEFRNVWPNGAIRWMSGKGKVIRDEAGLAGRMIGVGMDVTRRKRAEQSARFLARASSELAVLVDFDTTLQKVADLSVPEFADWATVDLAEPDGSLRRVAVAHVDPQKVQLAHELHTRFPPDAAAPYGIANIIRTGKVELISQINDEILKQSVADEDLLALIRQLSIKSYIGVPLIVRGKTLGVISFITAESGHFYDEADLLVAQDLANRAAIAVENSQLYRELREADRRKDEFLATLAHELRNPLAPIRNSLQILKMPHVDGEIVERSRDMMERQVHHLIRLVDDLIDVSRVMRGKIELRREQVELATVIARAIETVQPLIDSHNHDLSINLCRDSLLLHADPVRLTQIISNLLTNAVKYTEPNGQILIAAEKSDGMAVLHVRDNGIGIDREMLPRIFELFMQVDQKSTKAQGGLGIGLTLVKNLVEMHGGTIEVHSGGLTQGSEFVVRLPLSEENIAPHQINSAGDNHVAAGCRLLVVDDNEDAANSLVTLLALQGNQVSVAYCGATALAVARANTPDLVLLDIGMPDMDGYEVARRMRELPGTQKTLIAALTGWGQEEDRRRSMEAGVDFHLVKPLDLQAFDEVIRELKRRNSE